MSLHLNWHRSRTGAQPGHRIWRRYSDRCVAVVERGQDSGWWYWHVLGPRMTAATGQTETWRGAKELANAAIERLEAPCSPR